MESILNNKSYVGQDFIDLKKRFGDFFDFPAEAAPQMNKLDSILQDWYGDKYDIRFKLLTEEKFSLSYAGDDSMNYFQKMKPHLVIYYPSLQLTNGNNFHYEIQDVYICYELIFLREKIGISSSIYVYRNTYTKKQALNSYTHSHVSSNSFMNFNNIVSDALYFSPTKKTVIEFKNQYTNCLCLGTDAITSVLAELMTQTEENFSKLFTYFFGYMDNLLSYENIQGVYAGMLIERIDRTGNDNSQYRSFTRANLERQSFFNNVTAKIFTKEFCQEIVPFIDKIIFDGSKLSIVSIHDELIDYLLASGYDFETVWELDNVYYSKRNSGVDSKKIDKLFSTYEKYRDTHNIGLYFRDEFKRTQLLSDLEENEETTMYKETVTPQVMKNLIAALNNYINIKFYENVCSKTNKADLSTLDQNCATSV